MKIMYTELAVTLSRLFPVGFPSFSRLNARSGSSVMGKKPFPTSQDEPREWHNSSANWWRLIRCPE